MGTWDSAYTHGHRRVWKAVMCAAVACILALGVFVSGLVSAHADDPNPSNSTNSKIKVRIEWVIDDAGTLAPAATVPFDEKLFITYASKSNGNSGTDVYVDTADTTVKTNGFSNLSGVNVSRSEFIKNNNQTSTPFEFAPTLQNTENNVYRVEMDTTNESFTTSYYLEWTDTNGTKHTRADVPATTGENPTSAQLVAVTPNSDVTFVVRNKLIAEGTANINAVSQLVGRDWNPNSINNTFGYMLEPVGVGDYDENGNLKTEEMNYNGVTVKSGIAKNDIGKRTSDALKVPMPTQEIRAFCRMCG